MNIVKFFAENDFHDSTIDEITYNKVRNDLLIKVFFCNWRQSWYEEKRMPEVELKSLKFRGVENIEHLDKSDFEAYSILDVEIINDNCIKILTLGDDSNDYIELIISVKDVKFV